MANVYYAVGQNNCWLIFLAIAIPGDLPMLIDYLFCGMAHCTLPLQVDYFYDVINGTT